MNIDFSKLLEGSNPILALLVVFVLYLLKDKISGLFKKPDDSSNKPDGGGSSSSPLLDMALSFLQSLLQKKQQATQAAVAAPPADTTHQEIGLAAFVSLLKADADLAKKLKDAL